ncbi:MAG: hypothetical protein K0S38_628, partial [Candidatus Paceibacter sp.]|nr:hypothetical protein [Candidatus Paceibacter sp.]
MLVFLVIGILLGASVVVFALQNITPITVTFFSWHIEGSLAIILLFAVASGMLISTFLSLPSMIKKSFQISRLKKEVNKLVEELRNKNSQIVTEKS